MFSVWCHFLIGLIELFVSYLSCKQVDPSGGYENLVTVRSFMPHYHLAGGVNLPKIIDCVGSDGKSRRQLVKVSVCAFVRVLRVLLTSVFFLSFNKSLLVCHYSLASPDGKVLTI